jgi:hypothetical protein
VQQQQAAITSRLVCRMEKNLQPRKIIFTINCNQRETKIAEEKFVKVGSRQKGTHICTHSYNRKAREQEQELFFSFF